MSLLSLPDILGMVVLMGVLAWFRKHHRDDRVDGWLIGLSFILVEMIAASLGRGSHLLPRVMHVIALDSYLVAAVTFGWVARQDFLPKTERMPFYMLPAVPLFLLTTLYGAGIRSPHLYIVMTSASVLAGVLYLFFLNRDRKRHRTLLVAVHLLIWLPMLYLSVSGDITRVVYWGLACLYVLVALSFRPRVRPNALGTGVIMTSFLIWAVCFLAWPALQAHANYESVVDQIWNFQKFFVVIGMLLALLEDETQRRKEEALHDALTGLPNRRLFDDRLALALERSRRSGLSTAVFAIDLNGFKGVNDTYGHQMGDRVLTRVAERLRRSVRGLDTIARCGGDEFCVIVNDLSRPESCGRIADSLRSAIEGVTLPEIDSVRLGGSIGYAIYPMEAADELTLRQLADIRMYDEKKAAALVEVEA